jgi:hypothetical protein
MRPQFCRFPALSFAATGVKAGQDIRVIGMARILTGRGAIGAALLCATLATGGGAIGQEVLVRAELPPAMTDSGARAGVDLAAYRAAAVATMAASRAAEAAAEALAAARADLSRVTDQAAALDAGGGAAAQATDEALSFAMADSAAAHLDAQDALAEAVMALAAARAEEDRALMALAGGTRPDEGDRVQLRAALGL